MVIPLISKLTFSGWIGGSVKILVTGGAGYVGSHAVRELASSGHEVVIYDSLVTGHRGLAAGHKLIVGDIAHRDVMDRALHGVDAVMHFAASAYVGESMENPRKYFRNNVESALRFLDAVLQSPVRMFVFSSSCATYGSPASLPILESFAKEPINPYGETKLFFERVLNAYSYSNGLRYVALRYFNAAGAYSDNSIGECHDPETHLIPLAFRAALGTLPPLKVFGNNLPTSDGTCIRDYVHVSDLGRAHVKALEYLAAGGVPVSLNVATGIGTSIAELLAAIHKVTGRFVPHEFVASRPGDPPALYADPSLAVKTLGWAPQFGLTEILSTAWNWECTGLPLLLNSGPVN
jgi:UDP-glucose-4-epimerase GalE